MVSGSRGLFKSSGTVLPCTVGLRLSLTSEWMSIRTRDSVMVFTGIYYKSFFTFCSFVLSFVVTVSYAFDHDGSTQTVYQTQCVGVKRRLKTAAVVAIPRRKERGDAVIWHYGR